ncbi:hypothetical protein SLEP1_g24696 [Rubroshorea leprosula]|uniref:Uncharacterized protein n=1 Tax=Rubroshorea leprosula TaxID=152421 RepID=A0AAV5JQP5_9ROSI|nr:hypothetical protein SLEP1_g24696 [Rubroshorea leprosula]
MTRTEEYVSMLNTELLMSIQATDRTTRGWLAACKIKSRHLIETSPTSSSGEVDDIFEDDDPSIMQGSSLAIDLTAYQSLQLCAEGVTEVEVDTITSKEEEDYGEEKDSESSGNSDNVADGCLEILQVQQGGDLPPQDHKSNTIFITHSCLLIPRVSASAYLLPPDKPPKPPTFFPLEKPGEILMNFSSFLVKSQDLGLRIFSLNPENPESALLFSLVRRLLCGFEFLGIFWFP